MRGWIILDSFIAVTGFISMATGRQSFSSAMGLCGLGFLLLTLALGARLVRGRA